MIALLRSRRSRLPMAVLLLLVTQVALAGQSCRAVMLAMNDGGAAAAQRLAKAPDRAPTAEASGPPCCDSDTPLLVRCLVPDDFSTAAALVAGGILFPDLAPPPGVAASVVALRRADDAPSLPARSAAGPTPRIYIVYHRFLS